MERQMDDKKIMEQWEKDYRELLDKEIPQGSYEIGGDKFKGYTGKGGYINYLVEIKRHYMQTREDLIEELESNPPDKEFLEFKKLIYDALWGNE